MTKLIFLCGLLYALVGCAVDVPLETVKVPVYVRPVPPQVLLECGFPPPGFQFYGRDGSNDIIILERDQEAFQAWIHSKNNCILAWRAYGSE